MTLYLISRKNWALVRYCDIYVSTSDTCSFKTNLMDTTVCPRQDSLMCLVVNCQWYRCNWDEFVAKIEAVGSIIVVLI